MEARPRELDTVRLLENFTGEQASRGDLGVIVAIHGDPPVAYEVEICDLDGRTRAQLVLREDQFEVVKTI